jgi:glycosyltransferase involved in cell wall biosynthesis
LTKTKVLIVSLWPLGGIRTFLNYVYGRFPRDRFSCTLVALPGVEADSLQRDMNSIGLELVWAPPKMGSHGFWLTIARLLFRGDFQVIHSQGYASAVQVAMVNWVFRVPHIMTTHGAIEKKYFQGRYGRAKRLLFERAMKNVTVFHAVGYDILEHLQQDLTKIDWTRTRSKVIHGGIDVAPFIVEEPDSRARLREQLGIESETFVFGYFGRFMPEKGFNYLLEAVGILAKDSGMSRNICVLAVGSGDFEAVYKKKTADMGLASIFHFRPFSSKIASLIKGCDAVIMPSLREAYPLLSSEVLCCGTPLIASDCVGLREATVQTPTITVEAGNSAALARAMSKAMGDPDVRLPFAAFREEAAKRFDVQITVQELSNLFDSVLRTEDHKH